MKKTAMFLLFCGINFGVWGQTSGNLNYERAMGNQSYQKQTPIPTAETGLLYPSNPDLLVEIKGMANVKADNYVAMFSITQFGKTVEEVNTLLDNRIGQVNEELKKIKNLQVYVDMVSFVPTYEYETEKKIFSRKTYNEVPTGFELKKNLHINYTDPADLNLMIAILAKAEIYDLVKVDYVVSQMETVKKDLLNKAKIALQEKIKHYQLLVGENIEGYEKRIFDKYKVVYPTDMYQSYQVYNASMVNFKKNSTVNFSDKSTTLYYQALTDKDFDFVINPVIVEPVVQVIYEIKMLIVRPKKEDPKKPTKEYFLITPNGELKSILLEKNN